MKKSITIEVELPDNDELTNDDVVTLTIFRHDGSKIYEQIGRNINMQPVSIIVYSPSGRIPDPWIGKIIV